MHEPVLAQVSPYDLSTPGGVQGQVVALALELDRRGRRVRVLSPGPCPPELRAAGIEHLSAGSSRGVAANGSQAPLTFSLGSARRATHALLAAGTEVVHLHEPVAPVTGWPLLRHREVGRVATFHRSGVDLLYRVAGALLGPMVRSLDATVAVSPAAASTAAQACGVHAEVLFNGIDVTTAQRAEPWPTDTPTVFFVGRDEPRKGRSVLLEAASLLPENITVWVTGVAPEGGALDGRGARVEFLGVITEEEKRQRLRGADVLCAPSLGGESFGMVLLEALAAGCGVVASDIDGYRQVLGANGILVPPGDPAALAVGLTHALEVDRQGAAATRLDAVVQWSIGRLVDHYEPIYERARASSARRHQG